ncbi:MAG: HpcH/HpaI aldolase family protein [Candidatus Promineifilaceae bacterium]
MRPNRVKQIWKDGGAVVNGWLNIPDSWSAEVMAHQGFDSLVVDFQHGFHDVGSALRMFQAISTTDVVPMARVPWNEPIMAQRLLDAGAYGIICPMVNSREECEQFVGACRYFPDGYRSKGPTRARVYAGADYAEHANREIVTIAMVETATALEQIDEICSTPELDGIYVGPGDLSLTLGGSQGMDFTEPMLVEALDRIYAACQKHGIAAGIHCGTAEYARHMIEKGWQFVTIATDSALMAQKAKEVVQIARGEKASVKASLY